MMIRLLALALFISNAKAADLGNSCANCHKDVANVSYLEHNYADWEDSIHARAGVDCQSCHGGNPAAQDKAGAHAGIKPSSDPKSPVYFTRVPATCGSCHAQELKAFKKSRHAKMLGDSGRGPNCVTCHGSMANHVLTPRDLELTCTLCHRSPTKAYAARMALEEARAALRSLDAALKAKGGEDVQAERRKYQEALEFHGDAVKKWHTFDMKEVQAAAGRSAHLAAAALKELRNKKGGDAP